MIALKFFNFCLGFPLVDPASHPFLASPGPVHRGSNHPLPQPPTFAYVDMQESLLSAVGK